jgi:putative membrane protein
LNGGAELQEQLNKLSKLEGLAFDKEYIKMMVDDHVEDVKKFKIQGEHGRDIETKAFASGKLTILTHHLDMAKTLHDSMERS